jgi:hypothetical protein
MAFLTRTDGYQTMGDTKKMTKMSVIINGVLLYRNSFPWITFISYETFNYGKKLWDEM